MAPPSGPATAGAEASTVWDAGEAVWRKARASEAMDCVEVAAAGPDVVLIRDSKNAESDIIAVPRQAFTMLVARLRNE